MQATWCKELPWRQAEKKPPQANTGLCVLPIDGIFLISFQIPVLADLPVGQGLQVKDHCDQVNRRY